VQLQELYSISGPEVIAQPVVKQEKAEMLRWMSEVFHNRCVQIATFTGHGVSQPQRFELLAKEFWYGAVGRRSPR
jgi:hypothetical protein